MEVLIIALKIFGVIIVALGMGYITFLFVNL